MNSTWEITYYSDEVQAEIMELPKGIQARYVHLIQRMAIYGPALMMPHTRSLKDGLFELRIKSGEGAARVFYCTLVGEKIVMLSVFLKKSQKTPERELKTAQARMKEIKSHAHQ